MAFTIIHTSTEGNTARPILFTVLRLEFFVLIELVQF